MYVNTLNIMQLQATCWQKTFSYGLQIVVLKFWFVCKNKQTKKKKRLDKEYTVTQSGKKITRTVYHNGTIWRAKR